MLKLRFLSKKRRNKAIVDPQSPDKFPQEPDRDQQHAAMKKLEFLTGSWQGKFNLVFPATPIVLPHTYQAQYELGGLLLSLKSNALSVPDSQPAAIISSFSTIWFNDRHGEYRIILFGNGFVYNSRLLLDEANRSIQFEIAHGPMVVHCSLTSLSAQLKLSAELSISGGPLVDFLKSDLTPSHP